MGVSTEPHQLPLPRVCRNTKMERSINIKSGKVFWASLLACTTALLLAALFMLKLSWFKWPDVLVDFGRELYVPWMLTEGKVLYHDIIYFNGPLSPYWNSIWFSLFGPGLSTLVKVNLAIIAVLTFLIFRFLQKIASPCTAYIACLVFIFIFAFGQYVPIGNYNYVCPYSHEATHGMLLSWMVLVCLATHMHSNRPGWLAGAGFALGLVFLTKPEFFLSSAAAVIGALGLWVWLERPAKNRTAKSLFAFFAALLIPPTACFLFLSTQLPWTTAAVGTLGGWWYVWDDRIVALAFYRKGLGLDAPAANALVMFKQAGIVIAMLTSSAALSILIRNRKLSMITAIVVAMVVLAIGWYFRSSWHWSGWSRSLPLFTGIAIILMSWALATRRRRDIAIALILGIFSLVLLSKMMLNTRFSHYGFVLAMPATLFIVTVLLTWIPSIIRKYNGQPLIFYTVVFTLLALTVTWHVDRSSKFYAFKNVAVGQKSDRFLADWRGDAVNLALNWLKSNTVVKETLAVMPEGIMINFLARRENSTPITNLMPPEMIMFGEEKILQSLRNSPPDYIALVHKDTTEYGYRFFGRHYGKETATWIARNYNPVFLIGDKPLQDDRFGILIAKRRE